MKIKTRLLTLAATLSALCVVTGMIPYVFFLPVVVACATLSFGMSAFVGLAFGCVSLVYSYVMPMSPVSLAFAQAPYIAIIPRVLAALGACGVFKLINKLAKPTKRGARFAAVSASAATGSILNTALVVGMFLLIMPGGEFDGVTLLSYAPIMLISGAIECVCMAGLAPPIVLTLEKTVLKPKPKMTALGALASDTGAAADTEQATDNEISPEKPSASIEQDTNDQATDSPDLPQTQVAPNEPIGE